MGGVYLWGYLPGDVWPGGVCLGGVSGQGGGGVSAGGGGDCLGDGPYTSPLWTKFLTHACENVTFPLLRLRTVTM